MTAEKHDDMSNGEAMGAARSPSGESPYALTIQAAASVQDAASVEISFCGINAGLDAQIDALLNGWKFFGSGYNLLTDKRDLEYLAPKGCSTAEAVKLATQQLQPLLENQPLEECSTALVAMSEAEFTETFGPIEHPFNEGCLLFDHSDEIDLAFLKFFDEHHIWTQVTCDDDEDDEDGRGSMNIAYLPGVRRVNREGYLITLRPWSEAQRDLAVEIEI